MRRKRVTRTTKMANVVGPLMRRLRMDAGLGQKELAARCEERGLNLTRSTLAKIEAEVRLVKAPELFIIAKVLKVSKGRFFPPHYGDPPPCNG